jgi:hypothetical protein
VIPFRTEIVEARAGLRYFLESVHWLDASKPPWQQHLPALTERVKALLNGELSGSPREFAPAEQPKPAPIAAAHKKNDGSQQLVCLQQALASPPLFGS